MRVLSSTNNYSGPRSMEYASYNRVDLLFIFYHINKACVWLLADFKGVDLEQHEKMYIAN
jgi:hypothetical protein